MTTDKPNPGSPEATAQGCTCPVMDNHYGAGFLYGGERVFYMNMECPLHGEPQHENEAGK